MNETPINKKTDKPLSNFLWHWFSGIIYKRHSFLHQLTLKKTLNLGHSIFSYLFRREQAQYLPPVLKVDLSPLCNLHCPICVHATPKEHSNLLSQQHFDSSQVMPFDQYKKIIDEVKGKTQAIYLYLMGEPFMHPQICEMSSYANDASLNVLVSSHFSFKFPDKKIAEIANSGITHLEVSMDGATQEVYEQTRVGGRLDYVLDNLTRLCAYKKAHNLRYPKIEVQCLAYDHNRHEVEVLRQKLMPLGIDMFTTEEGDVGSWAELAAENFNITANKPDMAIPSCHWPYAAMVIKYDGDAIPCCLFNMGKQFAKEPDRAMTLGNVFEKGVATVWNDKPYRDLRRYVAKPSLVDSETELQNSYCYGCPQLSVGTIRETIASDSPEFNIRTNQ